MDENTYTNLIVSQIRSLYASASTALDADHEVVQALATCLDTIGEGAVATPVIPQGFTEESYAEFLAEQYADDVDVADLGIVDVSGYVQNEDGSYTEVGNFAESARAAAEQIAEMELDGEEIQVENLITITYSRLDEGELTEQDVRAILEHPISKSLEKLGAIQLISIDETETPSTKEAVFAVLEENDSILKTLAVGAAAYRGISVFPGLGRVSAEGSVNYL